MMKVAVLTGSPYHPGTSEQLADAFVKGVAEVRSEVYRLDAGRWTDEFSMIKLEDNHPGQEVVTESSDVITNEVIPKLLAADMIVLVSSLHYYGVNAALKVVIDRFYSYNHELHGGKKAITLVSGYGQADAFASPNLYLKQLLEYIRWDKVGEVLAADSWDSQNWLNTLKKLISQERQLNRRI